MIGIYMFTNKINGHKYIGQSINIEKRYQEHYYASYNKNSHDYIYPIHAAIRKYGIENFSFEILEECLKEELNKKEIYWINYYDSYNNGYNQTPGGDFNPSYIPEIVEKRTYKLLNDLEINKKLSHKEETNPNAKLTKQDVISIRNAYREGKTLGEVYPYYKNKISRSGFQACWLGNSWKEVMPEVFEERVTKKTGGSKRTPNEIYNIRIDFMSGISRKDLEIKYNLTKSNLSRILNIKQWQGKDTIPKGYIDFLNK